MNNKLLDYIQEENHLSPVAMVTANMDQIIVNNGKKWFNCIYGPEHIRSDFNNHLQPYKRYQISDLRWLSTESPYIRLSTLTLMLLKVLRQFTRDDSATVTELNKFK